jgi:hypothetical protein
VQQELIGRERRAEIGAPFVALAGWLWIAAVDAATVASQVRAITWPLRLLTALDVLGQVLVLGVVATFVSAGWRRLARLGRWRWLGAVGGAWLFARAVLADDLAGLHHWLPVWVRPWLLILMVALCGTLATGLLVALTTRALRHWPGALCLPVSGALTMLDALLFPISYAGLHLLGVLACGSLAAAGARWALPLPDARPPRWVVALAGASVFLAVARPPGNQELILLLREPGAVLAPYLAQVRPALAASGRITEAQRPWFRDRSRLPAIAPSSPPLLPDPMVILVGIDSFRADLMSDPRRQTDLPELFRLRRESTYFSNARGAGSSTVPSLAAVFSGLYYSQQYWGLMEGAGPDVYPDQDANPRFPELLSRAGVTTVTVDGLGFLLDAFGIVRGFREEQSLRTGAPYAYGQDMMNAAIARLERHSGGPLFLFLHLIDSHSPYTRAGTRATPFESYVAELGLADQQLGQLRQALERLRLADRTMLIVMSDHGEAFGEHGTNWHGSTLYDELLRVPLMIWRRGGSPKNVTDPVSLIDLGPTILDAMGVPTPARFMGQSLVPYLRGGRPTLTRPIIAEARLMRSLVTPEGMKVIYDTRAQTVEVFDLARDPGEENNLFGKAPDDLLGELRTFFQVHTLQRPGYQVPYRKW